MWICEWFIWSRWIFRHSGNTVFFSCIIVKEITQRWFSFIWSNFYSFSLVTEISQCHRLLMDSFPWPFRTLSLSRHPELIMFLLGGVGAGGAAFRNELLYPKIMFWHIFPFSFQQITSSRMTWFEGNTTRIDLQTHEWTLRRSQEIIKTNKLKKNSILKPYAGFSLHEGLDYTVWQTGEATLPQGL